MFFFEYDLFKACLSSAVCVPRVRGSIRGAVWHPNGQSQSKAALGGGISSFLHACVSAGLVIQITVKWSYKNLVKGVGFDGLFYLQKLFEHKEYRKNWFLLCSICRNFHSDPKGSTPDLIYFLNIFSPQTLC